MGSILETEDAEGFVSTTSALRIDADVKDSLLATLADWGVLHPINVFVHDRPSFHLVLFV